MGRPRGPNKARLAVTDDMFETFKRAHFRLCDVMKMFEDVHVSTKKNITKKDYHKSFLQETHNENNAPGTVRRMVNVPRTLHNRKHRISSQYKGTEIDFFDCDLEDATKEDVVGLRVAEQVLTTNIMLDKNNQEREIIVVTGESDIPDGVVCQDDYLIISPCPAAGNFPPLVTEISQVRYREVTNCVQIMDIHGTNYSKFTVEVFHTRKCLQAMLKKSLWDRSWRALMLPITALGVNLDKELSPSVIQALHEARGAAPEADKWKTVNDIRKGGRDLAKKMTKFNSIAMLRYVYTGDESLQGNKNWKKNGKTGAYYRDFIVSECKQEAENLLKQFGSLVVRPLIKAARKNQLNATI